MICGICNKEFAKRARGHNAKTCSEACSKKWAVKVSMAWQAANTEHVKAYRKSKRHFKYSSYEL